MGLVMLDRANDLLERANKLDDAVANLQVFRSLLEDLDARTANYLPPLKISRQQKQAIRAVRAAILRSAIALSIAILDFKRSDRASLGQITELLKDTPLTEFFLKARGQAGSVDDAMREKLQEVCDRYHQIYTSQSFLRVKQLRNAEIGHLLMQKEPTPTGEHSDVFAITDEIERQVITLHEGLGMTPPRFIELKTQTVEQAKLFWDTYFTGVTVIR